jgi:hypothetical protein
MEMKEALEFVDALVFDQVGKPLDDLERTIFRGAWKGQTYGEIAQNYHCSEGHVKDVGARLWERLSIALGIEVNKKNFRGAIDKHATLEREHALQSSHNLSQSVHHSTLTGITPASVSAGLNVRQPLDVLTVPSAAGCPFLAGPMITNPRFFVGRQAELDMMTSRMIGVQPISINVVGERRIGKSSLLYYFARTWTPQIQPNSRSIVIYLSLRAAHCQRRLSFYQAVARKLLQHPQVQARPTLAATLQQQPLDDETFSTTLENWRDRGVLPVLCLDEFEALLQYPHEFHDGFFDNLRFLMDFNALMLIVASKQHLETYRDEHRLTSSFFNLGHVLRLGEFPDGDAKALVSQLAGSQPALSIEAQHTSLAWGGRHPYCLQTAACCLWEAAQQHQTLSWAREQFEQQLRVAFGCTRFSEAHRSRNAWKGE